jgi:hypothetical protein
MSSGAGADSLAAAGQQYNEEYGIRGDANSTVGGSLASLGAFLVFLEKNNKETEEVSEIWCTHNYIRAFANYLVKDAVSQTSGELVKPGTVIQYLSGVVNEFFYRFPRNSIFEGIKSKDELRDLDWYKSLRIKAFDDAKLRCIKGGQEINKEDPEIDRDQARILGE